ncbi:RNB-domain-containing protein [Lentinula edodes]|uniref:RNB-domain-containing protein n=1 Tax=Lentinula edodes TaxID=5353 RepID=A0A1Q3E2J2_LENED|nr:RNB-domain-containing protein [Lentinula edodes]
MRLPMIVTTGYGRENYERAVQGDIVVIEVFPEKDWKAPADEVVDQEAIQKNDDAEDSGEEGDENDEEVFSKESRVLSGSSNQKPPSERQPTGRIVGIIKRNWRAYVCHIDSTSLTSTLTTSLSTRTVFATPVSRLLPRIRLRTRRGANSPESEDLVTIDRWVIRSRRTLREGPRSSRE